LIIAFGIDQSTQNSSLIRSPEHRYKYVFCGCGLAAKDILDQHGRFRELDELSRRIDTIEERLSLRP